MAKTVRFQTPPDGTTPPYQKKTRRPRQKKSSTASTDASEAAAPAVATPLQVKACSIEERTKDVGAEWLTTLYPNHVQSLYRQLGMQLAMLAKAQLPEFHVNIFKAKIGR